MLDLLVFAAIAAAIVVAILALLKVMIEYPGMGDWCLRFIHRKTEKNSKISGSEENFEEIIVHDAARNHLNSTKLSELRCEKTEPTSSKSVSRTSTETEVFKRRWVSQVQRLFFCIIYVIAKYPEIVGAFVRNEGNAYVSPVNITLQSLYVDTVTLPDL